MIMTKIQQELKAPKGQVNKFGNYKYRSCEDIVEAVKPILAKYDCYLVIRDDIARRGDRYYIEATAEIWKDSEGDPGLVAFSTAYAREPESKKGMDESQITGAASSYARKYALNGLLAIDDTKDADTQDNSEPQHRFKPGEKEAIISSVKDALEAGDDQGLREVLDEYDTPEEKMKVWALFNSTERAAIKELMK